MRLLIGILCLGLSGAVYALQREPGDGRLMPPEKITENVWVMRQPDRLWAAVIGNVTIIEQSDGVVLIDSGGTIADGREIVDAVAQLTPKPIKAVAITHWHNDHPLGVPAVVARYPAARIIGTKATSDYIRSETATGIGKLDKALNDARYVRAQNTLVDLRKEMADPKVSDDMRGQYEIELKWITARAGRQLENFALLPTETVTDRLLIDDPVAPVELMHLGTANTHGDLIAWLPRQKLVAAGDVVVAPTPYGFTVSTKPWLETLDRIEQLPFKTLVPGHGRVQRDRAYLATLKWSMREIAAKAAAAAANRSLTKDQAIAAFNRTPHEVRFGAADAWTRKWLNDYWLEGMFGTAFDEARGVPAPGK